MAKQDDFVRYTVRVPADLYERVKDAAGVKSVNAEIVHRLEASFDEPYADADRQFLDEMRASWRRNEEAYTSGRYGSFLHIVLDVNGQPYAWADVTEVAGRIAQSANFNPQRIEISVLDASLAAEGDSDRRILSLARNHHEATLPQRSKPDTPSSD